MKEWEYVKLDHLNMLVPAAETLLGVFRYPKTEFETKFYTIKKQSELSLYQAKQWVKSHFKLNYKTFFRKERELSLNADILNRYLNLNRATNKP